MATDTVEIAYLDIEVRKSTNFDNTLKQIGVEGTKSLDKTKLSAKQLDDAIGELGKQTNVTRKAFQGGTLSADAFEKEMTQLNAAHRKLIQTQNLNSTQLNKLTSSLRTSQASLDAYRGKVSKLGLAHNVAIGTTTRLGKGLLSLGAVAGVALPASLGLAATGMLRAANAAADTADAIDKGAQSAGLSIEAYQELAFVFDQNGLSSDQLGQAMRDLNSRLGQAAQGNKGLKTTFDRLGISIFDTNGEVRSTEEVFNDAITKISGFESSSEKAATASALFGEEAGRKMVPLLNQGTEAIEALRAKAQETGQVLDTQTVMTLVEYKDRMAEVQTSLRNTGITITAEFLPVIEDFATWINTFVVPAAGTFVSWLDTIKFAATNTSNELEYMQSLIAGQFGSDVLGAQDAFAAATENLQLLQGIRESYIAAGTDTTQIDAAIARQQAFLDGTKGGLAGAVSTRPNRTATPTPRPSGGGIFAPGSSGSSGKTKVSDREKALQSLLDANDRFNDQIKQLGTFYTLGKFGTPGATDTENAFNNAQKGLTESFLSALLTGNEQGLLTGNDFLTNRLQEITAEYQKLIRMTTDISVRPEISSSVTGSVNIPSPGSSSSVAGRFDNPLVGVPLSERNVDRLTDALTEDANVLARLADAIEGITAFGPDPFSGTPGNTGRSTTTRQGLTRLPGGSSSLERNFSDTVVDVLLGDGNTLDRLEDSLREPLQGQRIERAFSDFLVGALIKGAQDAERRSDYLDSIGFQPFGADPFAGADDGAAAQAARNNAFDPATVAAGLAGAFGPSFTGLSGFEGSGETNFSDDVEEAGNRFSETIINAGLSFGDSLARDLLDDGQIGASTVGAAISAGSQIGAAFLPPPWNIILSQGGSILGGIIGAFDQQDPAQEAIDLDKAKRFSGASIRLTFNNDYKFLLESLDTPEIRRQMRDIGREQALGVVEQLGLENVSDRGARA